MDVVDEEMGLEIGCDRGSGLLAKDGGDTALGAIMDGGAVGGVGMNSAVGSTGAVEGATIAVARLGLAGLAGTAGSATAGVAGSVGAKVSPGADTATKPSSVALGASSEEIPDSKCLKASSVDFKVCSADSLRAVTSRAKVCLTS